MCRPHHVAKNNSCCRVIFLCLVVKRMAARAARVHRFRAQQCLSPYSIQKQLLLRPTKMHHNSLPPPCLPIFDRIDHAHIHVRTWAESRKPVRNRISVYISVESLWNRFQTTSRGGLETALESVLTRLQNKFKLRPFLNRFSTLV